MALKPFNSIGGFSVGEIPANVIFSNGDFAGNKANFTGNVAALGILTDNLYYANGTPWDLQEAAGSNTQIQFNDNNNFGASANFTFNSSTNTLGVTGNANISGTVNTANINSGTSAFALTANGNTTNFYANGVVAFPANVSAPNFIGNVVGNISGNISAPGSNTNIIFNDGGLLAGSNAFTFNNSTNVLSVTGNISSQNASLGNLATANYVNVANDLNVTNGNITVGPGSGGSITGANLVSANFVTGTLTTAAQPNITSVGNLTGLTMAANADISLSGVDSQISGANLVSANFVTGTLTTAAQPNITSVGTLSSLDVTGNITTSANLVTDLIVGKTTSVSISATGANSNVFLKPTGVGTVDVWGARISNVAAPTQATDAATKEYVDAAVEGLNVHDAAYAATTNTLAVLTGGTITYNNGTAGVGATLTLSGSPTKNFTAANTFDGNVTAVATNRILVKNEANAAHNGVYVVTSSTVLTRADDYNTVPEVEAGDFIFVQEGDTYNDTGWVQTSAVTTIGTDPINFTQFSGAGTYTAGTGLTLNGTQFSISNTAVTAGSYGNGDSVATFTVNAQGQLTNAANVAITANAANLSGTTLNANIVNSSLTSVGTLGNLAVSGNGTFGNVYANSGTIGASLLTGTLTTAAQPNITSVGTLSSLAVTGNVVSGNVYANSGTIGANIANITTINSGLLQNGNSNVAIAANGNVTVSVAGTANVLELSSSLATLKGDLTLSTASGIIDSTGNLELYSGTDGNNGAYLAIGSGTGNVGGDISIISGEGTVTNGGNIVVQGGIGATDGGAVTIQGGSGESGGQVNIVGGIGNGSSAAGNINLTSGLYDWKFDVDGNTTLANTGYLNIGDSATAARTLTTTATTANQTIASFSVTGVTGVEFLVKGIDSSGAKYSVATVQAVTDGANVDYTIFATVNLGTSTGSLAVNVSGGNLALQVTPASSNSTVWTTQYRFI